MILAVDTDALVHWAMAGAPSHRGVRRLVEREVRAGGRLGLVPQVLYEFLHVVTDARRFEHPLEMADALALVRDLWGAREAARLHPGPGVVDRAVELLDDLRLGRKRILDTVLAATLEAAGARRLLTLNRGDFAVYPFLDLVSPE